MKKYYGVAVLVILFVVIYVVPLGIRPLITPDETRYSEVPREMIESGDWVVPRLNGLRYFEKPPLGYWITAASISAFGQNEFAVRLPSALSVGLTAILIFLLASRSRGGTQAGLLASAVYLASLEVFAVGVTNVLDSVLTLFLTAALCSFLWAHLERDRRKRILLLVLVGIFCGLAFLTKGFLALVIPALVVGLFLVIEKRWKDIVTTPWIPFAAAIVVALPWSIMIAIREPEFWRHFIWSVHLSRFLNPDGPAHHPEPFWYFLPLLLGSLMLWIPLLPALISGYRRKAESGELVRFAGLWFLGPFLFFSASSGKLGTYVLPCFPPLAILIALALNRYFANPNRGLFTVGATISGVLALASGAAVLTHEVIATQAGLWYGAGEEWKWKLLAAALGFWGIISLLSAVRARKPGALWLYAAAPALLLFSINFVIPAEAVQKRMPGAFILENAAQIPAEALVFSDVAMVPAVCWYLERTDLVVAGREGELRASLSFADSAHRSVSIEKVAELLGNDERARETVVIMMKRDFLKLLESRPTTDPLPEPSYKAEGGRFVIARFDPTSHRSP